MTSDAESVPDNPISSSVINASDDDRGDNEFTSDLGNSPVKGKSTAIGSGNRGIGSRGPIGPRPGVFRPCARCRTKKTKCDKVKPTCSNCLKSGSDTPCVYDNDEPLSGITATSPHDEVPAEDEEEEVKEEEESPTSSSPSKVGTSKQSKIAGKAQHGSSKALPETIEPIAANRGASKSQGSHKSASNNQNNNNGNNNGNANNINNETDLPTKATPVTASSISATNGKKSITSSSQSTSSSPNPSDTPIPPVKKIKTGSASSAAIRPSPLRTSVTTTPNTSARSPPPKSPPLLAESGSSGAKKRKASMSNGSKASSTSQAERGNGTNGRRYVKENDEEDQSDSSESDDIVSDLSIKEAEQDQEQDGTSTRPVKREFKFRPPKTSVNPSSKSNGGANGKFIVELTPRQSPSVFVIDKNQKARKWGKSGIAFQTLGGMVSIPLWTSDQEMLLNDPKPLYTQQSIPMMTTGRKDSSLARIAVLSQLDMDMDMDSPERGNTPDSLDGGSPDPTTPPVKRKRGIKRPQSDPKEEHTLQGNGSSKLSAIKKALLNKRARAESGNANVVEDIEGDEDSISTNVATNSTSKASSARSTPAPTQQRPRTFPCSFEGCNKSFMDKFHLDRHEARHVTEEIVCGIDGCTKAYNSISTVRRHQSMMHKDRKLELDAAAAAATAAAAITTAAAEVVEAEVEAEAERTRKNSKSSSKDVQADATTKKTTAKRGKSKSSAPASTAEPEPVKMTLILKDVKDSAYRPWMDSAETSTPLPLRDSKQSGISNPKQQN
ncbi:hypothetical protein BGZ49_010513 [Haplosporangium sp. Z 27]|nr:hypothetical protein BGZ49_010513 [Haplosporangium sp. Z 27]